MAVVRFNNDASNCRVTEAIQSLLPELRELIYKHFLTIKLRESERLWVGTWFTMSFQYNLSVLKGSGLCIFWYV